MSWVFLDSAFVPAEEARIGVDDRGLLQAYGLFETFRARDGAVYRLDRHVARLREGAGVLGIEVPEQVKRLRAIVHELAERCELDDARMRLTLTAGPDGGPPRLFMQARAATDYPEELHRRGLRAVVAQSRRNETSPIVRVKSLAYLDNAFARNEGRRANVDEALFLNTQGRVAETSAANVFAVRDGEIATPPVEDGLLPGVTREAVLELAGEAGIGAREASLTLDELLAADEAFLTNAIVGVIALVEIDGRAIGRGAPGEVTCRVRALYERATRS